MSLWSEKRDGLQPIVSEGFGLPGFRRVDRVVGDVQECHWLKASGFRIGGRDISKLVWAERNIGERSIKVGAGVKAGNGLWLERVRLRKVSSGDDDWMSWLPGAIGELEVEGFFTGLIEAMQREYEQGRAFAGELVPAFLGLFSDYNVVVDHFDGYKEIMFADPGQLQRAVGWLIGPNMFEVAVGEALSGRGDYSSFRANGKRYWVTNWQAVWYPTEERDIAYAEGDWTRRTELLHQSFEVLTNFLRRRY